MYIYIYIHIVVTMKQLTTICIYIYIHIVVTMKQFSVNKVLKVSDFYLFRCVLSSVLPLRIVGRSNFDKGRHNLTTLIQKSTYINESCYIL